MSGWVLYLMLDITTHPHPVRVLLLVNLLGHRSPTIAKPVLCLEPSQWAWALDGSRLGLYCLVEVSPLLPSPYKKPEPPVMSGEAGWTARSMHLHYVLGTSQVWAHTLIHALTERYRLQLHYWRSRNSFRSSGVWAYSGHGWGVYCSYKCTQVQCWFYFLKFTRGPSPTPMCCKPKCLFISRCSCV